MQLVTEDGQNATQIFLQMEEAGGEEDEAEEEEPETSEIETPPETKKTRGRPAKIQAVPQVGRVVRQGNMGSRRALWGRGGHSGGRKGTARSGRAQQGQEGYGNSAEPSECPARRSQL